MQTFCWCFYPRLIRKAQTLKKANEKAPFNELLGKGGFEPPRLTAPPPQDGASASSATSARGEVRKNRTRSINTSSAFPVRAVRATSTASLELAPMEPASTALDLLEQASTSSALPVLVPQV